MENLEPIQGWQNLQAHFTRRDLLERGLYPTHTTIDDPDNDIYEHNIKKELPQMIDNLTRDDLIAVYRLATLWGKVPPTGVYSCLCGLDMALIKH